MYSNRRLIVIGSILSAFGLTFTYRHEILGDLSADRAEMNRNYDHQVANDLRVKVIEAQQQQMKDLLDKSKIER